MSGSEAIGDETRYGAVAAAHTTTLCVLLDRRGKIVYANAAARETLPAASDSLDALLARAEDLAPIAACVRRADASDVEIPLRTVGGASWHAVSIRPVRDRRCEAAVLFSAVSVAARRAAEEEVRRLAYHDRLSGLPNRVAMLRELESRLLDRDDERAPFGLLMLNLDRFKRVNDELGPEAGDAVLRAFAARLCELVGTAGTVGRLGGDEFVVLTAPDVDPESLARTVLDAMSEPLPIGGQRLHARPSIGVCSSPEHGESVGDLMRHADAAMTAAKRESRGYRLFDAAMGRDIHARLVLESDLEEAVRSHRIEAHYQPRVSLRDGRVVGFEALARWRHPERGLLLPSAFIETAEETGLIAELGAGIMLDAMVQQRDWARVGHDMTVSVNVSARQLARSDFLATVADGLARAGCDPTRIELEITESVLIDNAGEVAWTLGRIADLGLGIAIDDFGTGYSNLAYLGRYPLATLKIDRTFVADPEHVTVLEAIIGLGHALDLALVAEGVETPEQALWLAERGVGEAQGYLYGRPLPATECGACLGRKWPLATLGSAA